MDPNDPVAAAKTEAARIIAEANAEAAKITAGATPPDPQAAAKAALDAEEAEKLKAKAEHERQIKAAEKAGLADSNKALTLGDL